MEKYFSVLKAVSLFKGMDQDGLDYIFSCLKAKTIEVNKNDFVLLAGDKPENVGLVLAGQLHVIKEDYGGGRDLLTILTPGELFAETLCCAGVTESPVSVVADTSAVIMLFPFQRIIQTCPHSCSYHTKLIENMMKVLAMKNLLLQARMEFLGKKTIRDKIVSYLGSVGVQRGRAFSIPFNREELADFLCIHRSALSRELARLKQEGVIDFWKNQFRLL